jgi:signal transduction histidine kinase
MTGKSDVVKLLRIAALLWLAYLGLSATIDYTLKSPGPVERFFYLADGGMALLLLWVTFRAWFQERSGRVFLPFMIITISTLPILANQIAARYLFPGPFPPTEAVMARVAPFLLIALLLVAWQYRWQHILFFSLGVALANAAILWAFGPNNRGEFSSGLFAIMSQVVTFVVVGLFISVMVGWLRSQRRSLEDANARLTNYSRTLEDLAITKERNRIAQELHDTLSHTLSGLSVQLETMKAYWDVDPSTARQRLDKSLSATRAGLDETRRILTGLRARPVEELGLIEAVRQMAVEAAARGGIALELGLPNAMPPVAAPVEQSIFRVAQEAITNALKHAHAQRLTVRFESADNELALTVQDDGVGFEPSPGSGSNHFGLTGMKERAGFIGGKLTITSSPGAGTIVRLTVVIEGPS